jgi:hypothetical protein
MSGIKNIINLKMKKSSVIFLLSVFLWSASYAQNFEVAAGVGYAYYYGDLNVKNLGNSPFTLLGEGVNTKNFKLSFSLGGRYYFPSIFSVGLNYYHMNLAGADSDNNATPASDANTWGRQVRNLSFHTSVNAGFLDLQIEPLRNRKRWEKRKLLVSPYIGGGIGFFQFNPKTMLGDKEVELQPLGTEGQGMPGYAQKYRLVDIMIPINAGLKVYFPSRKVSVALDFNYNHTFTDYIDDVSTVYPNPVDYQNAYQVTNPSLYTLVTALSDRGLNPHAVGEVRGHQNYDFFLTGQLKVGFIIGGVAKRYYDCCTF